MITVILQYLVCKLALYQIYKNYPSEVYLLSLARHFRVLWASGFPCPLLYQGCLEERESLDKPGRVDSLPGLSTLFISSRQLMKISHAPLALWLLYATLSYPQDCFWWSRVHLSQFLLALCAKHTEPVDGTVIIKGISQSHCQKAKQILICVDTGWLVEKLTHW